MVQAALQSLADRMGEDAREQEVDRIAAGIGEPNDIAYMVLYLSSDESKHVTGTEMVVDNGDTVF